MKDRVLKGCFIICYCLSSILFFNPLRIDPTITIYTYYVLFFVVVLFVTLGYKNTDNNTFTVPIILLLIAALFSAFSAAVFWNQSLFATINPLSFFMCYILFLLFAIWKVQVKDIKKIIIILAVTYMLIHTLTFIYYPQVIFGNINWTDNRGFPRIKVPGTGYLFLFSFFSLGQYLKERKFLWFFIFFISLIYIILTLTRTYIVSSFAFLAFFALSKSKKLNKIGAVLIITILFIIISKMNFFRLLSDQTARETNNIENNIRVRAADFYLFHFSPNTFTKIFGNGPPEMRSSYGKYVWKLQNVDGLNANDIGYIGLYNQYGIFAILAYLLLIIRIKKVSVPEEYLFCKYFLYFIFFISIIISAPFSPEFIVPIVVALFILSSKDLSKSNTLETT